MKQLSIFQVLILIMALFTIFIFSCACYAGENLEAWEKKTEDLNRRAENATDMAEMMRIMHELQTLMQQMPQHGTGMDMGELSPGDTPEEECERRIEAINRTYRDMNMGLARIRPAQEDLIPVPLATKLRGHIKVTGKDSDSPQNGWIPLTLQYSLREDFVGYLIITDYYDPKKSRFTDKREYMIHNISTGIRVLSLSGRQCVKTHSAPFVQCAEWRSIDTYDVSENDVYPAIHDWVVMGHSEGDKISLKIETPNIYFRSGDRKAGRGVGCYGTTIENSRSWLVSAIEDRSLQWKGEVGTGSKVTPRCEEGSSIELNIDLCDPEDFADVDECMQLDILLEDARLFLKLRDSFKDMSEGAKSVDDLNELVTMDIQTEFPSVDLTDEEHLDKYAGGFNPWSSEINVPDLCKGCKPRPLCRWEKEALEVHEKTHLADITGDSEIKKLFRNPELYGNVNYVDKAQAEALAGLEYRAYSEQARYIVDIIEANLSGNYECRFSTDFFVKLYEVKDDLQTGTFR